MALLHLLCHAGFAVAPAPSAATAAAGDGRDDFTPASHLEFCFGDLASSEKGVSLQSRRWPLLIVRN